MFITKIAACRVFHEITNPDCFKNVKSTPTKESLFYKIKVTGGKPKQLYSYTLKKGSSTGVFLRIL